MTDYLEVSQEALFPGLILFVLGWIFGTMGILDAYHVVGLNKFTLNLSFSVFNTMITYDLYVFLYLYSMFVQKFL